MTIAVLFWILALGSCFYAARYGGWEGRWFAIFYLTQCVFSLGVWYVNPHWSKFNMLQFLVDASLLIALYSIAIRTTRFWPLWIFGFHLITVSAHLAGLFTHSFSETLPFKAYFFLVNMWAVPKLLLVIIGINKDLRAGLSPTRRHGSGDGSDVGSGKWRGQTRYAPSGNQS